LDISLVDEAGDKPVGDLPLPPVHTNTVVTNLNSTIATSNEANKKKRSVLAIDTSFLSSPDLEQFKRVPKRESDPFFLKREMVTNQDVGETLIHYNTVGWHSTAIMISTLNALVDFSFSPDGDLFNVSWKACKAKRDRSSILRQVLRPITPGPLELKFGNSLVVDYPGMHRGDSYGNDDDASKDRKSTGYRLRLFNKTGVIA
jgi:hypothetical protein